MESGGSAACTESRDLVFSPCLENSWNFRCEFALPSVGLGFSKCVSPASHGLPRSVITDWMKSFLGKSKKIVGDI